jgi:DNA-directed RNA polymerase subunit RPC12/RpoP
MDYYCIRCGYGFFVEEGYDKEADAIICPNCGQTVKESEVQDK